MASVTPESLLSDDHQGTPVIAHYWSESDYLQEVEPILITRDSIDGESLVNAIPSPKRKVAAIRVEPLSGLNDNSTNEGKRLEEKCRMTEDSAYPFNASKIRSSPKYYKMLTCLFILCFQILFVKLQPVTLSSSYQDSISYSMASLRQIVHSKDQIYQNSMGHIKVIPSASHEMVFWSSKISMNSVYSYYDCYFNYQEFRPFRGDPEFLNDFRLNVAATGTMYLESFFGF